MTVCVVDDDASIRRSLERLLGGRGFQVRTFGSPLAFLETMCPDETTCLLLDVRMPERDGLEVQEELAGKGIPIIIMSAYPDVPVAVRAMKGGALDFLPKPFSADALLEAVERALARRRAHDREARELEGLRAAFALLTPRERQVLGGVVAGKLNKQIAFDLQITEKTVKVHRARVLEKMGAESLPELVRMYDRLERTRGLAPEVR